MFTYDLFPLGDELTTVSHQEPINPCAIELSGEEQESRKLIQHDELLLNDSPLWGGRELFLLAGPKLSQETTIK